MYAHIAACLLKLGVEKIPRTQDGQLQVVRHKCPNKNCCEPSHLELGTHKQNSEDMIRDGTQRRGEAMHNCKITEEIAAAIKMSWRPKRHRDYLTVKERGNKFCVPYTSVVKIDQGKSWSYLPGPPGKTYKTSLIKKINRNSLTQEDYDLLRVRILKKCRTETKDGHDTPCQIWTGHLLGGYGKIVYKHTSFRPHVLMCEATAKQRTPDKHVVRHLCGRKTCCEPRHLKFGTDSQNRADAFHHGDVTAKLTMSDVIDIRSLGGHTAAERRTIGLKYGVHERTIKCILDGKSWAFIDNRPTENDISPS